MTDSSETEPLFRLEGSLFQQLTLRCIRDCQVDDVVSAYILGIQIGQLSLRGSFQAGEVVALPVNSLPLVDLPATIRLASINGSVREADGLVLKSADAAEQLVGPGEVKVEQFDFNQGMLRGFAVNRINGLHNPLMFVRINGVFTRQVAVDRPRLRDEGGCSFSFAVQLYLTDFGSSGFHADLYVVGQEAPVASFQYARADSNALTRQVLEMEGRLAQVQQMTSLQIATLGADFRRQVAAQQQRVDAFIDYASCLLFDQVASDAILAADDPALELDPEMSRKIANFRALIASATEEAGLVESAGKGGNSIPRGLRLKSRSSHFSFGWYDSEADAKGDFRWMGQSGMVLNPAPNRTLQTITIELRHLFKAEKPMLRLFLDTQEVEAVALPGKSPNVARIVVTLPPDEMPREGFQTLRIESFIAGRPADEENGGNDPRLLSIAVSEIVFSYTSGEDIVQTVAE